MEAPADSTAAEQAHSQRVAHSHAVTIACMGNLAIRGGEPVRRGSWLTWPASTPSAARNLEQVLRSYRWSPTAVDTGYESFDARFCEEFARYLGVRHCVTTANGTAAIRIALEAAGIGW